MLVRWLLPLALLAALLAALGDPRPGDGNPDPPCIPGPGICKPQPTPPPVFEEAL